MNSNQYHLLLTLHRRLLAVTISRRIRSKMTIDGTVTGGLALAWMVIKELLAMLKPLLHRNGNGNGNKAGEQTKDFWEMKFAIIVESELEKFFAKRDLTIREIMREEIREYFRAKGAGA
jgi:hypothetical protein